MDINAATLYLRGTSPRRPRVSTNHAHPPQDEPLVIASYSTRKAERLLNILLETLPPKRLQQLKLRPNLKETVRWILQEIVKTNNTVAALLRKSPLDERALFGALRTALVFWIQERARAEKIRRLKAANTHVTPKKATRPQSDVWSAQPRSIDTRPTEQGKSPQHEVSSPFTTQRTRPDEYGDSPQAAARRRDMSRDLSGSPRPPPGFFGPTPSQSTKGSMQMVPGSRRNYVSEYTLFEKRASHLGPLFRATSQTKRVVQMSDSPPETKESEHPQIAPGNTAVRVPSLRAVSSPLKLPDLPNVNGQTTASRTAPRVGAEDRGVAVQAQGATATAPAQTYEVGSVEFPTLPSDDDENVQESPHMRGVSDATGGGAAALPQKSAVSEVINHAKQAFEASAGTPSHADTGGGWVPQHITLSSGIEVDFMQSKEQNGHGGPSRARGNRGRRSSLLAPPSSLATSGGSSGSAALAVSGGASLGTTNQGNSSPPTAAQKSAALRERIAKLKSEHARWDALREDLEIELAAVRSGSRMSTLQERDDLKTLHQQATEYSENLEADLHQLNAELQNSESLERAEKRQARRSSMASVRLSILRTRVLSGFAAFRNSSGGGAVSKDGIVSSATSSAASTPSGGVRTKQLKMSAFDLWELFQIKIAVAGTLPAMVRRRAGATRAGKMLALGLILQDLKLYQSRVASLRDTSNTLLAPGAPGAPGMPPFPAPVAFTIAAGGPKKKKKLPKTRRLFWEKIDADENSGAIWDEIGNMDAFVDRKEVEHLFSRAGPKKKKSHRGDKKGKGKKKDDKDDKHDSVFGDDLRQLEICFRGLRQLGYRTGESVVEAIDNVDSSGGFAVNACERLMRLLPTTEQLDAIQQIPPEQMHVLDRYLYDIFQEIPDVEKRLEVIILKDQFADDLEAQSTVLRMQLSAVRQVVASKSLKTALGVVRSIGNVLNDGDSERGGARGFELSVLKRLTSTKSNLKVNGKDKMNFLQFAAIVARRSKADCNDEKAIVESLKISPTLDEVQRVRRFHVLDTTVCDCDVLTAQFAKAQRYIQSLTHGDEGGILPRNMAMSAFMAPFLKECGKKVTDVEKIKVDLVAEYTECMKGFGLNPKEQEAADESRNVFFCDLLDFANDWDQALKFRIPKQLAKKEAQDGQAAENDKASGSGGSGASDTTDIDKNDNAAPKQPKSLQVNTQRVPGQARIKRCKDELSPSKVASIQPSAASKETKLSEDKAARRIQSSFRRKRTRRKKSSK